MCLFAATVSTGSVPSLPPLPHPPPSILHPLATLMPSILKVELDKFNQYMCSTEHSSKEKLQYTNSLFLSSPTLASSIQLKLLDSAHIYRELLLGCIKDLSDQSPESAALLQSSIQSVYTLVHTIIHQSHRSGIMRFILKLPSLLLDPHLFIYDFFAQICLLIMKQEKEKNIQQWITHLVVELLVISGERQAVSSEAAIGAMNDGEEKKEVVDSEDEDELPIIKRFQNKNQHTNSHNTNQNNKITESKQDWNRRWYVNESQSRLIEFLAEAAPLLEPEHQMHIFRHFNLALSPTQAAVSSTSSLFPSRRLPSTVSVERQWPLCVQSQFLARCNLDRLKPEITNEIYQHTIQYCVAELVTWSQLQYDKQLASLPLLFNIIDMLYGAYKTPSSSRSSHDVFTLSPAPSSQSPPSLLHPALQQLLPQLSNTLVSVMINIIVTLSTTDIVSADLAAYVIRSLFTLYFSESISNQQIKSVGTTWCGLIVNLLSLVEKKPTCRWLFIEVLLLVAPLRLYDIDQGSEQMIANSFIKQTFTYLFNHVITSAKDGKILSNRPGTYFKQFHYAGYKSTNNASSGNLVQNNLTPSEVFDCYVIFSHLATSAESNWRRYVISFVPDNLLIKLSNYSKEYGEIVKQVYYSNRAGDRSLMLPVPHTPVTQEPQQQQQPPQQHTSINAFFTNAGSSKASLPPSIPTPLSPSIPIPFTTPSQHQNYLGRLSHACMELERESEEVRERWSQIMVGGGEIHKLQRMVEYSEDIEIIQSCLQWNCEMADQTQPLAQENQNHQEENNQMRE